jgi:DNA-binding NtrC family response regulator
MNSQTNTVPTDPSALKATQLTAQSSEQRILIADDNAETCKLLKQLLEEEGLCVDTVADGSEALTALIETPYSVAVTDLKMPHVDGIQLIKEVKTRRLPVAVVVSTGYGSIGDAVKAMQLGAADFLTKPIDIERLGLVIRRVLRERELSSEVERLHDRLRNRYTFHNIITKNARMHAAFDLIRDVAKATTTVLIEGETGTGKELVARAIHEASDLRNGPFMAINCAAVPETLLESELFGHEKGAFTGATGQRKGRFELADGGSLFLDEVGDVPASMQAKLLRVLQERSFERVGGTQTVSVDVRVIAATNRALQKMVRRGTFREDLYYRLNVVKIDLPPLRERVEDIPLLITHFAQKYSRPGAAPKEIPAKTMEILLAHKWPGNVRELENAIERACVTSCDTSIAPEQLPPEILNHPATSARLPIDLSEPLVAYLPRVTAALEERYIRRALKKSHGHIGRCAQICGLSRGCVSEKIAQYKLDRSLFKPSEDRVS